MSTRDAILRFRHEYTGRYGTENSSTPSDVGQMLGLQEARLLAVALLLEVEPGVLLPVLDCLVWDSDLSDQALSTARGDLPPQKAAWPKGYWESFGPVGDDFAAPSDTVMLGSEALATFIAALKAPPPLADALRRAFNRWALLHQLSMGEMEFEAGEVQPASEVFNEIRQRTPEERAALNSAIQRVVENFPAPANADFDAVVAALVAKWRKQ